MLYQTKVEEVKLLVDSVLCELIVGILVVDELLRAYEVSTTELESAKLVGVEVEVEDPIELGLSVESEDNVDEVDELPTEEALLKDKVEDVRLVYAELPELKLVVVELA